MPENNRRQCLLLLKDRQHFSPVRKHVDAADYKIMSRFGGSKLLHYCTTSCVTERTRLHCTYETTGKRMYICVCDFLILRSGIQCLLRDSFFTYRHVRHRISRNSLVSKWPARHSPVYSWPTNQIVHKNRCKNKSNL